MPTLVKMPKWGLTMTVGTVTDWLRQEGDEISAGEPLLTVETEKAVNDVEAPADGILLKIVASSGEEVPVSGPVAVIVAPGEELSDADIMTLISTEAPQRASVGATDSSARTGREPKSAAHDDAGRVNASPAARKLAQQLGIDLSIVDATGPGGRITSDDVERIAANQSDDPSPKAEAIAVNGIQLSLLTAGPKSEKKLVFLHGLSGSQSTWQVVMGDLAENYRVAALDLPGHGQSDKPDPASTDYSVSGMGSVITAALKNAGLAPAILVGHSLGGAIALRIALDSPELVNAVVLINSAGLGEEVSTDLTVLMDREPGPATSRAMLELFFADQSYVLDRGITEMAQAQLSKGAWSAQRAVAQVAFSSQGQQLIPQAELAKINVPTLIVWGAKDRVFPIDHAYHAASLIPDALLRVLPMTGHVPQVEAAPAVSQALDRFARSLD